jgi:hypothetical protein
VFGIQREKTRFPLTSTRRGKVTTHADFNYKITPDTIAITDTGLGKLSVANDIDSVLRKIEFWHQGSISSFKITYQDEHGAWKAVRWDGQRASF